MSDVRTELRKTVARALFETSPSLLWTPEIGERLGMQADRILSIPQIKEALAFHEACQKAFAVNGEFTVTEENVTGKGGVSAS